LGAVCIWSTSFVATKIALAEVPPLTLGAARFLVATVVVGGVVFVVGGVGRPERGDVGRLALGGLLGITAYFSMENFGVKLASASDAALLVASYPAIAMLLEIVFYRARASAPRFWGVGLAMLGVYLVVGGGSGEGGSNRLLGDAILVATGFVWALYNFSTRGVVQRYSMLTVVFYQTLFGTAAFVPLALLESGRWQAPGAVSLLVVGYLGIFCSLLAFLLYARGLRGMEASAAVNLLNLVPVLGVVFAVALLGEPVGLAQVLGGIVVVGGVALGARSASDGKAG
jgi:drug/metabolite transporter (DMT)-like permease